MRPLGLLAILADMGLIDVKRDQEEFLRGAEFPLDP